MFEACKFKKWDDIQASRLFGYLSGFKNSGEMSQRTFNFYLKAGKQFCRWMLQDQRAHQSPLEHLRCETITKVKRQRRALNTDELRRLLEATRTSGIRFGMSGHERALLYRFATETGLRAKEIRGLKVSSFDFPNLTVTATNTKNKKTGILPLRADMAVELQDFFAGKTPNAKAFGGTYKRLTDRTAEMLKRDLAEAKIDYIDGSGRYFDFHSLRGECASLLAASGVHPKTAQSIMRHSDINLTMNAYTHTLRGQEAEAINSLPNLSLSSGASQRATGTDDLAVESAYKPAYKKLTKNAYSDSNHPSLNGNVEKQETCHNQENDNSYKVLSERHIGTDGDSMSPIVMGDKSNGRYRIRTCDRLIKSQLLYQLS